MVHEREYQIQHGKYNLDGAFNLLFALYKNHTIRRATTIGSTNVEFSYLEAIGAASVLEKETHSHGLPGELGSRASFSYRLKMAGPEEGVERFMSELEVQVSAEITKAIRKEQDARLENKA